MQKREHNILEHLDKEQVELSCLAIMQSQHSTSVTYYYYYC